MPAFARCAAMREPMVPAPRTAARRMRSEGVTTESEPAGPGAEVTGGEVVLMRALPWGWGSRTFRHAETIAGYGIARHTVKDEGGFLPNESFPAKERPPEARSGLSYLLLQSGARPHLKVPRPEGASDCARSVRAPFLTDWPAPDGLRAIETRCAVGLDALTLGELDESGDEALANGGKRKLLDDAHQTPEPRAGYGEHLERDLGMFETIAVKIALRDEGDLRFLDGDSGGG